MIHEEESPIPTAIISTHTEAPAEAAMLAGKELVVDGRRKARFELIPPAALRELAELYDLGAEKYGDRNWERGRPWGDYIAACYRHLNAFHGGEEFDPKDGQRHLASVAWLAFALMTFTKTHPELDDRPEKKHTEQEEWEC